MEKTINLIIDKEFKKSLKGYDREDVDNFLDEIIEEIERFEKEHNLMMDEKKLLEKNNFELKMQMLDIKSRYNEPSSFTENLGATKLVTPNQEQEIFQAADTQPVVAPTANQVATPVEPAVEKPIEVEPVVSKEPVKLVTPKNVEPLGEAKTIEDSLDDDFTLQDRISKLEEELNNIKHFTE